MYLFSSLAVQSEDHGIAGGVGASVAVLIVIIVIVIAVTVIMVLAIKFHLKTKCSSKLQVLINIHQYGNQFYVVKQLKSLRMVLTALMWITKHKNCTRLQTKYNLVVVSQNQTVRQGHHMRYAVAQIQRKVCIHSGVDANALAPYGHIHRPCM